MDCCKSSLHLWWENETTELRERLRRRFVFVICRCFVVAGQVNSLQSSRFVPHDSCGAVIVPCISNRCTEAHGLWILCDVNSRMCSRSACAQMHHNICSSPRSSRWLSLESRAVSDERAHKRTTLIGSCNNFDIGWSCHKAAAALVLARSDKVLLFPSILRFFPKGIF